MRSGRCGRSRSCTRGSSTCRLLGRTASDRGARFIPYDEWIGAAPVVPAEPMRHLVRRYLAAFGPATIDDMASWMGVRTPPIRAALDEAPRTFRDEAGRLRRTTCRGHSSLREIRRAPARRLAKWDSPLLAYSPPERTRGSSPSAIAGA